MAPPMTVLIYVDTSKQVGDPDHLKVFANADAAEVIWQVCSRRPATSRGYRSTARPRRTLS